MLFKRHYPELDLLRSLAIVFVMLFHLNEYFELPGGIFSGFLESGFHGVDLFFALSGFLIGGQLIEENLSGDFSLKRFYLKRFLRIFPPYYMAIIIYLAIYSFASNSLAIKDSRIFNDVIVHALYLQNYIRPLMQGGLYWSLAVEEQFYVVIPLVLYLLVKYKRQSLLYFIVSLLALAVVVRMVLHDPSREWWLFFYVPFHTRFDALLYGVLGAYFFIRYKDAISGSRALKVLLPTAAAVTIGLTFAFGSFGAGYFNTHIQFPLIAFGFSALILYLAVSGAGRHMPLKSLFSWIARLSYSMYLYHILVLFMLRHYLAPYFHIDVTKPQVFAAAFLVYFAAVLAVSSFFYSIVDRPCMGWRKRLINIRGGDKEGREPEAI